MGIRMRCSQGILLAAVIPYKLPRMGSTVSGTAQPSQQPGPALCAAARAFLLAWPCAAEGRREAHSGRQRRGSSSRCAGTETWGGLDVGGFLRRSKAKMEKGGGSEVRKRSRERRMLKRKPCRRLKEATHQHKLTPSQNCLKSSGSSWRLPVLIAL